jgi:uncharacterized damage-inducible protein DinB
MNIQQKEAMRVQAMIELFCGAAQNVPSDKHEWKPEPEQELNSPKELLEHIAAANYAFATAISGESFDFQIEKKDRRKAKITTENFEEAISAVQTTGAKLVNAITDLPDDQMRAKRTMPWGEQWDMPRLLTVASAHITYHWGQLAYLQTMWGDFEDRM